MSRTRLGAATRKPRQPEDCRAQRMATPRNDDSIIIAGGGIAGLSAAIALARTKENVRLVERGKTFPIDGAGIQLGANATRILREWGALDRLLPHAVRAEGIGIGDGLSGKILARVPLGDFAEQRYGAPYLLVHRADLHNALLTTAREFSSIEIITGAEATDYDQFIEDIVLKTSKRAVRGRALIAADGIWSNLRTKIDETGLPGFTGKTAWRTLVDPAVLPEELQGPWTGLWMAPNAHLVHYPVQAGKAVNIVAVIEDRWFARKGWNEEADPAILMPNFERWDPKIAEIVAAGKEWRKWSLYDLPPLRRACRGTALAIGDAAHPIPPFLAQGGALAIEDAAVLARLLSRHDDMIDTFIEFENERIARTARMRFESRRMGEIYHMRGLSRRARDFALQRRSPEALLARYDWIYGYDALASADA